MFKTVVFACAVAAAGAAFGAEHELKWDSGRCGLQVNYNQGLDTWFANDFDTSGIWDSGND